MNVPIDDPQAQDNAGRPEELDALEANINAILPPRYIGCFEDVPASSMGSAKLQYDKDGKVAWGTIWTTFCHLALAGGPPHRGRLLGAVSAAEALAHPAAQVETVAEIKRAIQLTTGLATIDDAPPGWVGIRCHDEDMAAWLVRAIVAENVVARHQGDLLYVPAGPHFRTEKEVKNVVVCVAKASHYLVDHVEPDDRPRGFSAHLVQSALPEELAADPGRFRALLKELRAAFALLELKTIESEYPDWIGIQCSSEEMAIWMQRAVIVENVLARRESDVLFVPVDIKDRQVDAHASSRLAVSNALRLWRTRVSERQNSA